MVRTHNKLNYSYSDCLYDASADHFNRTTNLSELETSEDIPLALSVVLVLVDDGGVHQLLLCYCRQIIVSRKGADN